MSNKITVVANLVKDPEIRYTQNGKAVVSLRLADTPRSLNPVTNEWEDGTTLWLTAVAWDSLAENAAASLAKGMKVVVTGSLTQRNYKTKDGEDRIELEIKAEEISPSLRYATATVTKKASTKGGSPSVSSATVDDADQSSEAEPF
jgi:single-strand DNA-binding protein